MTITHRFTLGWTPGSGQGFSRTVELSSDGENNRIIEVPAPSADKVVALAVDVSQLKGLALLSDQDLVVKTNDVTEPDNIFTLKANVPFLWTTGGPALRDTAGTAVTTDIASLHIVHAGDTDAEVQIGVLVDSTL